jgi:hypothetical protein
MAEIVRRMIELDEKEMGTSDPVKLEEIRKEREHLIEVAYSGAY